ncbi:DNA polymerase III subunit alpha [Lapidilactobacillus bayanensis]|uniref:DNA polymerase III subunit alpha n=1 Tax=Lapidilactobacillus bayanensis TaxID=2485998 RepID=UPI000F79C777|nr:DNA polymerase III subunit alpha [Lapidilactobacillus bayanensis]
MTFVNLQVRSCFSLLQSSNKIDDLVKQAQEMGYDALALTDLNTMYGVVHFYRAAKAAQIKPIIGLTLQLSGLMAADHQYELILLAQDNQGYHDLFRISSLKMTQDQLSWSEVAPLLAHLIVIMPPKTGETAALLLADAAERQAWHVKLQQQLPDDAPQFYMGISTRQSSRTLQQQIADLATELDYALVALDDVRYLHADDAFTNEVLAAIDSGSQIDTPELRAKQQGTFYLETPEQVSERFARAGLSDAAALTATIADRCQVELEFKRAQLPHFAVPEGTNAAAYLRSLAQAGLKRRLAGQATPEYQERLDYELKVIGAMGFADYFLIVWDVIRYAHQQKIMTGPGRGSAAGSLVAYTLGITEVDPLKYHLLFERFLNPDRVSMPDIDLDIPDNRRDELIQYMHERYGDTHMAQIITFGTMAAKQALRDVGRTFNLMQNEMSDWSKAIPSQLNITLREAYQKSEGLKNLVAASDLNQLLFKTALAIEGLPRHYSTHAAGIVLGEKPLTDTVPMQNGGEGIKLTQLPKGDVEALGLLKMDFLGLRNLTILDQTVQAIRTHYPELKAFDPRKIDLEDSQTLQLFQKGDTDGVFQFESDGIRNVLIKLKPTEFRDIVATNALYRPGPMENIPTFIARKNGQGKVAYPIPELADVLGDTYGVLVYQEQVMQVAVEMGGFSMGQADILRRAVSKKKKADLDNARASFIAGAQKQGYSVSVAMTVYDYIERFANYGFNKSHAVAYSMIAFWLAYLKVHFPAEFFLSLLNANLNNERKTAAYLQELRNRKIEVAGPDINLSQTTFTLNHHVVRFGFEVIKGIRRDFVRALLDERQANGRYKNLNDFLKRQTSRFLKLEPIITLAKVGCFDSFDENRKQVVANLENLIESLQLSGDSVPLFDVLAPKVEQVADYSNQERLELEKELLGAYVSGHPLSGYQQTFNREHVTTVQRLTQQPANLLVYLHHVKVIRTKRGEQMAFVSAEDLTDEVEITVFPRTFHQAQSLLEAGKVILVKGKLDQRHDRGQKPGFIADVIMAAQPDQQVATLYLQITAEKDQAKIQEQLQTVLLAHQGLSPVIIHFVADQRSIKLAQRYQVQVNGELIAQLATLLGSENVVAKQ